MKTIALILFGFLLYGCSISNQNGVSQIDSEIESGNYSNAYKLIDSIVALEETSDNEKQKLLFTKDSLQRVALDFNKDISDVTLWIKENHGFEPSSTQIERWEREKVLEYRIIDNQKKYFRNAAANLFRISENARSFSSSQKPTSDTPKDSLLVEALQEVDLNNGSLNYALPPKTMIVSYTLSVKPNVVKDGEVIRAWLPYPRKDISRQTNVKFISASETNYILSNDKTVHTSIYMEKEAQADEATVFSVEFEFTSQGEWFNFNQFDKNKSDSKSIDYKYYTSERKPHIQFTDAIKDLTDSITKDASTTSSIVSTIYNHIVENYPWASALEYSTINNIPEYVIENRKGDCGQVALLLITMLRYKGVPARWQSGWMMHPNEVNLHDWAEYYIEGIGWIPIDVSFGRSENSSNLLSKLFFISGIDSYRLYVNNDYSGNFYPEKKHPRSETVDFQRGEVETKFENIYFNKWTYKMQVVYK
ncbi:MAG: transglutaminase-like domain-containing protein [Dysgonamonadaceae bacterium]|nr:transglutaminase-like domain-containing protein [Dysgonamonadaceae bacterium]MDD4727374.1 transglutaminase-like domain-containing protein [Dysgonamonadaceae bacterium]